MNEEQFSAIMGLVVEEVVRLITENMGMDEISATKEFYSSKVYEILEKEDTKLWHLSPLTIFNMFDEERKTGCFEIPEEA